MNMVESWFSILTRRGVRRGSFASVAEPVAAIDSFVAAYNERVQPLVSTKPAEEVLAKAVKHKDTLERCTRLRLGSGVLLLQNARKRRVDDRALIGGEALRRRWADGVHVRQVPRELLEGARSAPSLLHASRGGSWPG